MNRAGLDKQPREVASMFDQLAAGYDVANTVNTFGLERIHWRPQLRRAVDPRSGMRVLDLAAGTGVSSVPLARAGAEVVACDFSVGMMAVGRRKHPELTFVAGDATRLPFADNSFDVVTISFGLRNIADTVGGLREMARVTRPGGRLVVLEMSRPTWAPMRWGCDVYMSKVVPLVATVVSSNAAAYSYLAESSQAWPDGAALARLIAQAGWSGVQWRPLTAGLVALHRGVKA